MPRKPSKNRISAQDALCALYLLRRDELRGIGLSFKERAIAQHMLDGESSARIAKRMYLSESGVKYHIGNIYGKSGVHTREDFCHIVRCGIERSGKSWANKAAMRDELDAVLSKESPATGYAVVAIANR